MRPASASVTDTSRTPARVGADGEPVLLLEQNRARWDRMLIGRGLAARACSVPVGTLEGKIVTTIEGLASNGMLHRAVHDAVHFVPLKSGTE